ncbi:MAG TPA: response regulator transcription factor [Actinomycetota bacterium]|nr:response regulator transcription factor [Actinomycetota bacterium]
MIRVVVADDQALFRAGARVLLEAEDDLELAGEAGDGRAAVELVRRELPDVVLMDVRMPVMDGIEATRTIAADPRLAGVRVVILTGREREVVGLVALGLANDEIADRLVVSPATVRTHVSRAMTKLHARDRAQLVVFAYQSGLAQTRSRPT